MLSCTRHTTAILHANSSRLPQVLYLKHLQALEDDDVDCFARLCRHLVVLDLSCCPKLTGAAVRSVGTHTMGLRMFNLCQMKSLVGSDLGPLMANAGSHTLECISLRQCHLIASLHQEACSRPHDGDLPQPDPLPHSHSTSHYMAHSQKQPTVPAFTRCLVSLNLHGCHSLTDSSLEPLEQAARLRVLSIAYCHRLTDRTLERLRSLKHLEHLDACYAPQISDTGMEHLRGVTTLLSFSVSHCPGVSTLGAYRTIGALPHLTEARLTHCRRVNAPDLLGRLQGFMVTDSRGKPTALSRHFPIDLLDLRGCQDAPTHLLQPGVVPVVGYTQPSPFLYVRKVSFLDDDEEAGAPCDR